MNLRKKLPVVLRSNEFWLDYADAVQAELVLMKAELSVIGNYFDPESMSTIGELRTYLGEFGLQVNISIHEDSSEAEIVTYLKQEADSIAFIIRKKGTKDFFDHLFNRISLPGYTYLLYSDSSDKRTQLFRALKIEGEDCILNELLVHDPTKPFLKIYPEIPFIDAFVQSKNLDSAEALKLDDSGTPWNLDSWLAAQSVKNTTHVSIEFMVDRIQTGDVLVDNQYLSYLISSVELGRKASQVPHFGVGLSIWTNADHSVFSIADTGVSAQASGTITDPPDPTDLYHEFRVKNGSTILYKDHISANEIFRNDSFDLINIISPGRAIYPETIVAEIVGSGLEYGATLGQLPVKKSLRIYMTDLNSEPHTLKDDGAGRIYFEEYEDDLETEGYSGTIDYTTGALTLNLQTVNHIFTPKLGSTIYAYYRTQTSVSFDGLEIRDSTGGVIISASFPDLILESTLCHASFFVIVDKRV